MVTHARAGGSNEIMGLMLGKPEGDSFVVTDAFRLPVEGTETRVNASDEANEYIVKYLELSRQNGQPENPIGWYHSHPGYGCWLSGIDVSTQKLQQSFSDPFLAVVIDPDRTLAAGKVDIGAFRTYPENYRRPDLLPGGDGYQSIPLNKIEDFGAHADQYYQLEISTLKNTLDTHLLNELMNKNWVTILSDDPLSMNRDYTTNKISDLVQKVRNAEQSERAAVKLIPKSAQDEQMNKVMNEGDRVAVEGTSELLVNEVKTKLFTDSRPVSNPDAKLVG